MGPNCIRQTDLPHATRLFTDLVYDFDRVQPFYHRAPFAAESYRAAAGEVRLDAARRRALVDALREQNTGSGPAAENLDRLSDPSTLVVATGQQVGLYTGPIFTIYKALSAIRLAEDLTARGIRAVPVFWLATEDHDLEEVNHAWIFDAANQPLRLEAAVTAQPNQPVGQVPLADGVTGTLAAALDGLPHGAEVSRWAAEAYAGGATFGSGFQALLGRLLAPHGLLLMDPQAPGLRRLAAPLIRRAIEKAPELTADLLARGQQLARGGYHVQVHVEEKSSLFFLVEGGRRTPLHRDTDTYESEGSRHSRSELLARLESHPEDFSPNVLLRPVIQDFLLPTVAYIGGPAELAYLAQAEVLYRQLLGRMPVALPRAGFTLLDARADKLLNRYGLTVLDALHGAAALEQRIAGTLIPAELQQTFDAGQGQIEAASGAILRQLASFDPTLEAAWALSREKMRYQLGKIRDKTGRESLRRAERARADAAHLLNLIFPEKTLQERLYSVLPFLARHGLDLIGRLHGAIRFDCPDHQVLTV